MNKKLLFIAGAFAILCFAALAFSNSFIAEKIDDAVSDYIREIENDTNLEIGYDDLTYNLITSTITLQDFEFTESKDVIEIGTIDFKIGLDDLRKLSESDQNSALSDFTMTCYEMDASVEGESFEMTKGTLDYSGRLSMEDDDQSVRLLRIELIELESNVDDMAFDVGYLNFSVDAGDEALDLQTLTNLDNASLIALKDIKMALRISDMDLPRASTREMELDDLGIGALLINDLEINANRNGDDLSFFFSFDTDMAEGMLDCTLDYSKSEIDPDIEFELSLNNLDKSIRQVLERQIDWGKDQDEFEFEFTGTVSEMGAALLESVQ
jgi:hypothetical protein